MQCLRHETSFSSEIDKELGFTEYTFKHFWILYWCWKEMLDFAFFLENPTEVINKQMFKCFILFFSQSVFSYHKCAILSTSAIIGIWPDLGRFRQDTLRHPLYNGHLNLFPFHSYREKNIISFLEYVLIRSNFILFLKAKLWSRYLIDESVAIHIVF